MNIDIKKFYDASDGSFGADQPITDGLLETLGWKNVNTNFFMKDGLSLWSWDSWTLEKTPKSADQSRTKIAEGLKTLSQLNAALQTVQPIVPDKEIEQKDYFEKFAEQAEKDNKEWHERFEKIETHPSTPIEEEKIIVWKDGSYKKVTGETWEYENDENWLTTIKLESPPIEDINFFCKEWDKVGFQCEEQCSSCAKIDKPIEDIKDIRVEYSDEPAINEANKIGIKSGPPLTYFIAGWKANTSPNIPLIKEGEQKAENCRTPEEVEDEEDDLRRDDIIEDKRNGTLI